MNSEKCIVVVDGPDKNTMFYGFNHFSKEYPDAEQMTFKKASDIAIKWKGKVIENYGMENEHVAYDASWRTREDQVADIWGMDDPKEKPNQKNIDDEVFDKIASDHNLQLKLHNYTMNPLSNPNLKLSVPVPEDGMNYAVLIMDGEGKELLSEFCHDDHDAAVERAKELISGNDYKGAQWSQLMVKRGKEYEIIEEFYKNIIDVLEEKEEAGISM